RPPVGAVHPARASPDDEPGLAPALLAAELLPDAGADREDPGIWIASVDRRSQREPDPPPLDRRVAPQRVLGGVGERVGRDAVQRGVGVKPGLPQVPWKR